MRRLSLIYSLSTWVALGLCGQTLAADAPIPAAITSAVADTARPDADTARDVNRKPAEVLAFVGVKPGDKVADYMAGSGYFTRLFSDVVGAEGHVYAVEPSEVMGFKSAPETLGTLGAWANKHANTSLMVAEALDAVKYPDSLDIFWISQNYHDLHDKFMGPVDLAKFNKAVFKALKPGGLYIVLDHAAAKGAAMEVTETLHRIDPETVKKEVEAAGFELVSESKVLANPADDHSLKVFDPSLRGKTDQFIYKFRKPKK